MKRCKHGVDLTKGQCWCTFRHGKYGLVNGQMVEYKDERTIARYVPAKERCVKDWSVKCA